MAYKRKIKIHPIPQRYCQNGKQYMVQERGELCYTVRSLDDFIWQYRVMERKVSDSPVGMIETLTEYQKYERFRTMEECEEHFHKVEAGEVPLMLEVR